MLNCNWGFDEFCKYGEVSTDCVELIIEIKSEEDGVFLQCVWVLDALELI